ncbi:type II toxin-antitoxin system VapC family toxin [Corynebacterium cystitidis]|uniref:Ribonuclease VapC n=1 Tax=Corynebacterium cystitidis DSM 20524 TaxID=1121357 RepID=A0A1H9RBD7_9CORY|nr:type II toxin-antitoxin system VapC family toxin [Corynebacterium cystitidis]WJY81507.1 Toxin FitB [Corynebacterium cystitidis DSM 20524]SER69369.1 hypothetical protein SAMN05661109_00820 [Corynebacterium cystitidis DSM 20524]SNV86808.1 PilT domain-containing protein [Corynebacterium cystitidis]
MIVLDTNVVSELMKPHPDPCVVERLDAAGDYPAITSLTVAEIFQGLLLLPTGKRRFDLLAAAEGILAPLPVLEFGYNEALVHASLIAERRHQGSPINPFDAQIAACVRVHNASLYTRNVKDFSGLDLEAVNPFESI